MKSYKMMAAAAASVLMLSGCGIYSTYKRPDSVAAPDSLYRLPDGEAASDTLSLASLSWRELFADKCLQKLIDTALVHNADLATARLKVDEAEALLMTSRLAYLPSVSLTPQGSLSSTAGAKPVKTYNLAVSADWELDIFGKLRNNKRGAQAALEQSEAYRQAVQTQLVASVANSYYSLLMLDEQLDIALRTSDTWSENVRTMQALKMAGQTTEMAVAQTEAAKLAVDASVAELRSQIAQMENSISVLVGTMPGTVERTTLDAQHFPDTLAAGVPLQLLSRRPDIRQSEAALAVAFYAENAARSAFYPSITLSGSAGWTNAAGAAVTNPGQWLLSAVGSLVQPLFNRGVNVANLRIAEAQQKQALVAFQQSLLQAGADVNDALVQWQTARQRIQLDSLQAKRLSSALKSAELLMQYSSQNYLEVLTARQDLLEAELSLAESRFDEIQGVINLYHALGGGTF